MKSALTGWWDGAIVGTLRLDEHGDTTFIYAPDWLADPNAPALSRSLPKQAEPFDRRRTRPFFAGLLPRSAARRCRARSDLEGNDFAFLALGGDVAGALTNGLKAKHRRSTTARSHTNRWATTRWSLLDLCRPVVSRGR
jgi:serine/threonine-protein kinase HipA